MLIISGRRQRDGLGYRTLIGGRTLVVPVIEKVARISLRNMQVALEVVPTAQSGGGTMMPVAVNGVANVKVSSRSGRARQRHRAFPIAADAGSCSASPERRWKVACVP